MADNEPVAGGQSPSSGSSQAEEYYNFRTACGRRYHAAWSKDEKDAYLFPNDNRQNRAEDLLHDCLFRFLGYRLYLAPIDSAAKLQVLDVGAGTGRWAVHFAKAHPSANVHGIDLTPYTQFDPEVAGRVHMMPWDCRNGWPWEEESFDFVHIRGLNGCIKSWIKLYGEAFDILKPGGWVESVELDVKIQSDEVKPSARHVYNRWAKYFYDLGDKTKNSFRMAEKGQLKNNMEAAHFENVQEMWFKLRCYGWSDEDSSESGISDSEAKECGEQFFSVLDYGLEGWILRPYMERSGRTEAEARGFAQEMRKMLSKKDKHDQSWVWLKVVWGQKPL